MNLDIYIDKDNHFPIYVQIKDQILGLIQSGQIKPGDRLPTLQELSVELLVNINTVALAYRDLTNNGTLISARGKGTFVAGNATEEEIQAFRVEKLQSLIDALLKETDHLGYSREEVGLAIVDQFRKGTANRP